MVEKFTKVHPENYVLVYVLWLLRKVIGTENKMAEKKNITIIDMKLYAM